MVYIIGILWYIYVIIYIPYIKGILEFESEVWTRNISVVFFLIF